MRSRSLMSSAVALLAAVAAVPDVAVAADDGDPDRRSSLTAVGRRVDDAARTRTGATTSVSVADVVRAYRAVVASSKPSLARQASMSSTVASDAPASAPTIAAPAPGSTVTGNVTVSATSTASHVRFTGFGQTVDVPVTDGQASTTLPSWGYAGAQTITAADCDEAVACGTAASVDVGVSNPAPVLTRPLDGATVSSKFWAESQVDGGAVRYLVDGSPVATAVEAPYRQPIYTDGMPAGTAHVLTAVLCAGLDGPCDEARPSAPLTFTVSDTLAPQITTISPGLFSPGTDGRRDTATVSYVLEQPQQVSWLVTDAGGNIVVPLQSLGQRTAGTHSFVFTGKRLDGSYLPSGRYDVHLNTAREVTDATLTGHAMAPVTIDRTLPRLSNVSAGPVYPVRDGYKDTTTLKGTLSERIASGSVQIRNSSDKTVRILALGARAAGTLRVAWNGRRADGSILPAGTYRYRFVLRDVAGNQATTASYSVGLSAKKLVKKSGSKTVTAYGSVTGAYKGACSELTSPGLRGWAKSVGYYSDAYNDGRDSCRYYENHDLAATDNATTLPSAPKYGSVRISAYGGKAMKKFDDKATLIYYDASGELTETGRVLGSAVQSYAGPTVGPRFITSKGRVRWAVATLNGHFYDVKSFTINYTYFVLR